MCVEGSGVSKSNSSLDTAVKDLKLSIYITRVRQCVVDVCTTMFSNDCLFDLMALLLQNDRHDAIIDGKHR